MNNIQAIAQQLAEIVNRYSADYIEARLEESETSYISYRGRELDSIGRVSALGGNVRAMVKGAWGFTSFNNLSELPNRVELAVKQAQFAGKGKSQLAPVEPVVDTSSIEKDINPAVIHFQEKKQTLDA